MSANEVAGRQPAERWTSRICRILLGGILGFSALTHLLDPIAFLDSVYSYQLFGRVAGWCAALLVPSVELALSVCFLTGHFLRPAFVSACGLFAAFSIAQITVVVRGMAIDCGCFGRLSHSVGFVSISLTAALFCISCFELARLRRREITMESGRTACS